MRIQPLCFHAKSIHNIVMVSEIQLFLLSSQIQPQHVMLVEIQSFPFSQFRFHVKLTTNLHHVNENSAMFASMSNKMTRAVM